MICTKCGAQLNEGMKFCGQCGTPVKEPAPSERFCTTCGTKLAPGTLFCTSCGTKIGQPNTEVKINIKPEISNIATGQKGTGKLLRKMSGVTKFMGEPAVGVANKLGTLSVYDDRVEFKRNAGLTLAGTVNALAKGEVETYYLSDCLSITNGTYLAIYKTMVLHLKNGNKVSFCPMIPGSSDMATVASLLTHYM